MGIIPGLIAGGASLIGSLANQGFAEGQVEQQEGFQERMANSQYQRGVADMRKAGLNPALMYGSAGPAPSPSGAMSQAQPFQNVVSSAVDAMRLQNDLLTGTAQRGLIGAQTAQSVAQAKNISADTTLKGLAQSKGIFDSHTYDVLTQVENWLGRMFSPGSALVGTPSSGKKVSIDMAPRPRSAVPAPGREGGRLSPGGGDGVSGIPNPN